MSVVYFIQAGGGGPIKIGTASNLQRRVETLQCGCPEPLVVLATISGGRRDEALFHAALRPHRTRGEWFKPVPDVLRAIDEAKAGRYIHANGPESTAADHFSPLRNIVGLIRVSTRLPGWSKARLADAAGLHLNALQDCDGEDWDPTLSTLLVLETFLLAQSARERAA